MTFYKPITMSNRQTGFIIYPEVGIENARDQDGKPILSRNKSKSIESYLEKLIGTGDGVGPAGRMNIDRSQTGYMVAFLWEDSGNIFCDFWDMNYNWNSGPLVFPYILGKDVKSLDEVYENNKKKGVGSGNTLIVLGVEEIHRRTIETELAERHSELDEKELRKLVHQTYFDEKNRPEIPFGLVSNVDFYVTQ